MSGGTEEIRAFLMLNRLKIEGRRRAIALFAEGRSASEALERMRSEELFKDAAASETSQAFDPFREIELCLMKGIGFLTFTDPEYPVALKEIPDPPLLLYMKGVLNESDRNAIAIVGTRHPSFYGRSQAQKFAQELSAKGLTVVSGLARGIDQVAHEGALQVSYGRTIAVMGCGLDTVYPKEHETLFRRVAERGAVLSEYPLGTPPLPENFPRRNRILSGLAYATLVVEAHSRSGSLITAHQAAEQGREVFALPGPVDRLTSRGTHQLIKEGACLVETPEDILLALADRLKLENKFDSVLLQENASPSTFTEKPGMMKIFASRLLSGLKKSGSQSEKDDDSDVAGKISKGSSLPEKEQVFPEENDPSGSGSPVPGDGETDVVEEVLKEEGPLSQEEILEMTGLEPAKLPVFLIQLELAKRIKRGSDGKYGLSKNSDSHQK